MASMGHIYACSFIDACKHHLTLTRNSGIGGLGIRYYTVQMIAVTDGALVSTEYISLFCQSELRNTYLIGGPFLALSAV